MNQLKLFAIFVFWAATFSACTTTDDKKSTTEDDSVGTSGGGLTGEDIESMAPDVTSTNQCDGCDDKQLNPGTEDIQEEACPEDEDTLNKVFIGSCHDAIDGCECGHEGWECWGADRMVYCDGCVVCKSRDCPCVLTDEQNN